MTVDPEVVGLCHFLLAAALSLRFNNMRCGIENGLGEIDEF
jgi:hypothetical protein